MSSGERRKHRSWFSLAMADAMARMAPAVGAPTQLDLFAPPGEVRPPRRGRPRTARTVYRGSNRRGYRRE